MMFGNVSLNVTEFVIAGFDATQRPVTVGVVILVVYVLVMIANMANLLFIIFDERLHKPMYLLIGNLAVVDMLYSSSASPTMIAVLVAGRKTISYGPCLTQVFAYHLAGVMEMFALSVMAFDRWVAISFPLRYHCILTNVHTVVLTCVLWVVACAFVAVMPATVIPLPYCHRKLRHTFCDYATVVRATCVSSVRYFTLITIISFFLLFFTFGFICLSYLLIVLAVMRSFKNDKRKMLSTCLTHLIVVVSYYCPLFVRIMLTWSGVTLRLEERHGLMIGGILGPSLINPFVYCLRTKEIKRKIFRVFTKPEPTE